MKPMRVMSVRVLGFLAAVFVTQRPSPALAIDGVRWPSTTTTVSTDPLRALRWPSGGWTFVLSSNRSLATPAQTALNLLDVQMRQRPVDARVMALRAVPLRLLERLPEARQAIDQARSLDPASVEDPDVALTDAFLLAKAGSYEAAVRAAQGVLPRLSGTLENRIEATIEVARWSLMRGNAGVSAALSLLRGAAAVQTTPGTPLVVALSFTLLLDQKIDEARFVARSSALMPSSNPPLGTLAPGLVDTAWSAANAYTAAGYNSVPLLVTASTSTQIPTDFRRVIVDALQIARGVARPREPVETGVLRPQDRRRYEFVD